MRNMSQLPARMREFAWVAGLHARASISAASSANMLAARRRLGLTVMGILFPFIRWFAFLRKGAEFQHLFGSMCGLRNVGYLAPGWNLRPVRAELVESAVPLRNQSRIGAHVYGVER